MPQSLNHVIVHYIFSTKDRQAFLVPDVRARLHAYLATVCRDMGAEAYRVGGVADHVHVLATLPRTVTQAEFIERMKKVSSKWIKDQDSGCAGFAWQRGYGAFSVSVSQMEPVIRYIDTQEEHHRHRSFQEEYREFLRRHGVAFDERYVWD